MKEWTGAEYVVSKGCADLQMLNREKSPHHLSFGQKKRVAIAGVLAMDPEVMILDEPTAYLDPQGQDLLFGPDLPWVKYFCPGEELFQITRI